MLCHCEDECNEDTLPSKMIADSGGRETPIVSKTTLLRTAGNPRQIIVL
ncbi:MAG: hypothetical protein LBK53_07380 [Heliobacteriaceae bacterium]|nr:hypothetical protein [Heliobacteriaceae bacterium]